MDLNETQEPLVTILTPVFNEVGNLEELVRRVRKVCRDNDVCYEHLVIDNHSTDGSYELLQELARADTSLKVIRNLSNYGHIRSPYYGLLQSAGKASIAIASDLQTPPEVIPALLDKWRDGAMIVFLKRDSPGENRLKASIRSLYYSLLSRLSDVPLVPNATGEGLYDSQVIAVLRQLPDPNPFLRGLVAQLGFPIETVPFAQQRRQSGESKNSWFALFDIGILGVSSLSRTPLRMISAVGFTSALVSLSAALFYLVRKLLDWDAFELGLAPIAIGLFFLASVQLAAIGLLGEYVGNIFSFVQRHPLVIEEGRLNFPTDDDAASSPDSR